MTYIICIYYTKLYRTIFKLQNISSHLYLVCNTEL